MYYYMFNTASSAAPQIPVSKDVGIDSTQNKNLGRNGCEKRKNSLVLK
jgi:hypothetical protein